MSEIEMKDLPSPVGWRVLIKVKAVQEKTEGGIYLAPQSQDVARVAAQVGQVIALGEAAYSDKDRFFYRWCDVGDWVMISKFAGIRFKVEGEEYRMLNDDEIIAKVSNPSVIKYYE